MEDEMDRLSHPGDAGCSKENEMATQHLKAKVWRLMLRLRFWYRTKVCRGDRKLTWEYYGPGDERNRPRQGDWIWWIPPNLRKNDHQQT